MGLRRTDKTGAADSEDFSKSDVKKFPPGKVPDAPLQQTANQHRPEFRYFQQIVRLDEELGGGYAVYVEVIPFSSMPEKQPPVISVKLNWGEASSKSGEKSGKGMIVSHIYKDISLDGKESKICTVELEIDGRKTSFPVSCFLAVSYEEAEPGVQLSLIREICKDENQLKNNPEF